MEGRRLGDVVEYDSLPSLSTHADALKSMDDHHADLYMFGESTTSTWVAPWQPSELADVRSVVEALTLGAEPKGSAVDLGCGDGRVLIYLAKSLGWKGVGWDVSVDCVKNAETLARAEGVADLLSFRCIDFTRADLVDAHASELMSASVVWVYLLPAGLEVVAGLLLRFSPETRFVTNNYHFARDDARWRILTEVGKLRVFTRKV